MSGKEYTRDPNTRYTYGFAGLVVLLGLAVSLGDLLYPGGSSLVLQTVWWLAITIAVVGIVVWVLQSRALTAEYRELAEAATRVARAEDPSGATRSRGAVAQRLQRIRESRLRNGPPSATYREDWRREAIVALEGVGGAVRFLASTLLLLAVLGTFAGMKEALPELAQAIESTTPQSAPTTADIPNALGGVATGEAAGRPLDAQSALLSSALGRVATAFGANLAALLGSALLAAMAFGLSRDARELVRRLELVSEQSLYPLIPSSTSFDGLQSVVLNLKSTLNELAGITGSVDRLGVEMAGFTTSLNAAISRMGQEVATVLATQQLSGQARIERQLTEVVGSLDRVTQAVEHTGVHYEALVKGLEERDLGVRSATATLEKTATQFDRSSAAFATAAEQRAEESRLLRENMTAVKEAQQRSSELMTSIGQQTSSMMMEMLEATAEGQRALRGTIADFTSHTGEISKTLEKSWDAAEARERHLKELVVQLQTFLTTRRSADAQVAELIRSSKDEQLSLGQRVLGVQQELAGLLRAHQLDLMARDGDSASDDASSGDGVGAARIVGDAITTDGIGGVGVGEDRPTGDGVNG
jgi:hypothetical protein